MIIEMTGGPIVLRVEMTGEMTPTRSYNVRENDRRFDRWTNRSYSLCNRF